MKLSAPCANQAATGRIPEILLAVFIKRNVIGLAHLVSVCAVFLAFDWMESACLAVTVTF